MPAPRCSCCYEETFDRDFVARELRKYRRAGAGRASRALVEALASGGVEGLTVLDIGAGVGAVHQLLPSSDRSSWGRGARARRHGCDRDLARAGIRATGRLSD